MKKLWMLGTLLAFCAPVFAAPQCEGESCPAKTTKAPRYEMKMKKGPRMTAQMKARMDAAKAERKARRAQFKANEEKLEKLVKEYKKAKEGSKKRQSLRQDIAKVLEGVRDEQIAVRTEKLQEFERRLARMKEGLAKEQQPQAKTAWAEKMTDKVIAEDGDLGEALMSHGRIHHPADGPMDIMGPEPDGAPLPPPPAPAEEEAE